jgi:hypothetical protein
MRFLPLLLPLILLTALSSTARADDPGAPESTPRAGQTLRIEFPIDTVTPTLVQADAPDFGSLLPPSSPVTSDAVVPERMSLAMNLAGGFVLAGLGLWRNRRVASAGSFSGARRIRSLNS